MNGTANTPVNSVSVWTTCVLPPACSAQSVLSPNPNRVNLIERIWLQCFLLCATLSMFQLNSPIFPLVVRGIHLINRFLKSDWFEALLSVGFHITKHHWIPYSICKSHFKILTINIFEICKGACAISSVFCTFVWQWVQFAVDVTHTFSSKYWSETAGPDDWHCVWVSVTPLPGRCDWHVSGNIRKGRIALSTCARHCGITMMLVSLACKVLCSFWWEHFPGIQRKSQ